MQTQDKMINLGETEREINRISTRRAQMQSEIDLLLGLLRVGIGAQSALPPCRYRGFWTATFVNPTPDDLACLLHLLPPVALVKTTVGPSPVLLRADDAELRNLPPDPIPAYPVYVAIDPPTTQNEMADTIGGQVCWYTDAFEFDGSGIQVRVRCDAIDAALGGYCLIREHEADRALFCVRGANAIRYNSRHATAWWAVDVDAAHLPKPLRMELPTPGGDVEG